MKKISIIFAIIFMVINVKAQWFLAGSIGLNVNDFELTTKLNNADVTFKKTEVGFSIAPKVGYYFNEKVALGLGFSVGPNFFKEKSSNWDSKLQGYSIKWNVFPFVRYSVFTYKKFFIILEGRTGVGGSHYFSKAIIPQPNIQQGKSKSNTLAIGVINITPILGFNLTEHLQIEAVLHFLNLGYNIDITKTDRNNPYDYDYTNKSNSTKHDLNIGFNSSSILVVTRLQFGVIYKF